MTRGRGESDRLGHDSDAIAGFLPLVDVLLAVLCTVMLAAAAAPHLREVEVELPPAVSGGGAPSGQGVRLVFDGDGGLWLDGEPVDRDALTDRLRAVAAAGRDVVIAGDAGAGFRDAAVVLQLVQAAGVPAASLLVIDEPK